MGKKKQKKEVPAVKTAGPGKTEEKGKKTYSLANAKSDNASSDQSKQSVHNLQKVTIPPDLEQDILCLIKDETKERKLDRELSKRLTSKKLTDMYTSLSSAGFSHTQIEQAMSSTVLHGGDLIDALDWLCLNMANDKLPANFSQTLREEEEKQRPHFDVAQQETAAEHGRGVSPTTLASRGSETGPKKKREKQKNKNVSAKDWIMQYMEQESDSDDSLDGERTPPDPNERYLELTAMLLDAKEEASEAKKTGNKSKQKEVSKRIRELILEMDSIEKDSSFNPAIKVKDVDEDKSTGSPKNGSASSVPDGSQDQEDKSCDNLATSVSHDQLEVSHDQPVGSDPEEEGDMGLALFHAAETTPAPAAKKETPVVSVKEEVRRFEYTRQQWTGKSPKQFLIDWVRKHLPKSPPPKFQKKAKSGNLFKCKVVVQQKEDLLEKTPDILCENVKEAEHLAATLALYHLCRGQSVHQLLPPPYRDVWLDWLEAERQAKQEEKLKENKPRDQFVSKMMSKLQLEDKPKVKKMDDNTDDTLESWENLEFDDEEEEEKSVTPDEQLLPRQRPSRNVLDSKGLQDVYSRRQCEALYKTLLKTRQELPVFQHQNIILEKLKYHNVVLVAGETGSGKSTQVPHFILQDCLLSGLGQECNIVCTEPRRISAISLAARVSQEMGEAVVGSRDSLCGYQIRFESKRGPNTRLLYCTTGVILRQLQMDPSLREVSHVIVDEVHERSVQSDFLLIILKQLLQKRRDLKVILMSATLDAEKFSAFFNHCPVIHIPGRTFPVEVFHVEDIVEMTGFVLDEDSPYALRQHQLVEEEAASLAVTEKGGNQSQVDVFWTKEDVSKIDRTNLPPDKYTLKTRNTVTRLNLNRINLDMILELLVYLDQGKQFNGVEGAVLVFLPGLADITELYEILQSDRRFYDRNKYLIIALHSILSSSDQASAFSVPPSGVRKVVLATNIAETGITIPDVVFVIDAGKVKENRYIETSQMNALEEVFVSKASAKQRQGRAGRVQNGFCFRLYTKQLYSELRPYTVPELLRVPLEELCLHIMKCDFGQPEAFLSQALDPPQPGVIQRAMTLLHTVGACVDGHKLTPLGHHLAALPVHVRIGKMLLYAAVLGCLEPVAVIAAAMTDKSPFVVPVGKQEAANVAKLSLSTSCSDQLTVYKAYLGWKEAQSKGRQAEIMYCQKHFLKRNSLLEIENVKSDLIKLLTAIGFKEATATRTSKHQGPVWIDGVLQIGNCDSGKGHLDLKTVAKIKAILTAGLYPNIARVAYDAPVDAAANPDKTVCIGETPQGPAHVHPSSVNRFLQANGWIVFHQKVRSSRVYLRDCSLISAYPLLLFGGEILVQHTEQLIRVDDRVKYKAFAKTGVIFKELRKLLDELLAKKLDNPKTDITNEKLVTLIQDLLASERTR